MIFLVLFIAIIIITLICLDISKKISLTHYRIISVFLIVAPHILIINYQLNQYIVIKGININSIVKITILIELLFFLIYIWIKLNIAPYHLKEDVSIRNKVMMNGRAITMYGLYAGVIQLILYIFGYYIISKLQIPNNIFIIDLIITILIVIGLLSNGLIRILFTSRRLSIIRRLIMFGTIWIPVVNILVILYVSHIVSLEYDHECYKVVNHKARVDSQICCTKYPLLLVHGVGFRDLKYINYWGRIPKELIRNGAAIYYGNQEAWGTIQENANDIKKRILEIVKETGCEKVNIIAHSKGGLDSRYLISKLDMGDYVASLTTMATPHRGSKVIDMVCKMPDKLYRSIARGVNGYFRKIGDKNPDFYTASKQFTTCFSKEFNEQVKDVPQVYYQSYCAVMKNMISDSLLAIPYCIVKLYENQNDGLVCIESAKWGEFKGVFKNNKRRGISHGDVIDLKREDYKGFDIIEKYVDIVAELKQKGY